MTFREAHNDDIIQIQLVRNAVTENTLSNPNLVTDDDCREFLFERGKGWVCEIDNQIVGFSIADLQENNIWALFVHPNHDKKGIGKELHKLMINWYFSQTKKTVWLGTAPGTRAETFYKKQGWTEVGLHGKETKFEMTFENWNKQKRTMKKYVLTFLLFSALGFAQDLNCSDFKTGRFRYPDSPTIVTRTETRQVEINPEKGYEIHGYIDWISECEYVLTWGKKIYVNPPKAKEPNLAGKELRVKIIKIEGNIMSYTARFDGIEVKGELIKILDN